MTTDAGARTGHTRGMTVSKKTSKDFSILTNELARLAAAKGFSESGLCKKAGLPVTAIRRIREGFAPKIEKLTILAAALDTPVEHLIALANQTIPNKQSTQNKLQPVPVVGAVQAGSWREALEWDHDEWYTVHVPFHRDYKSVARTGLEVRGNSMNAVYPDGSIVIVVKFIDLNRQPEKGERVVCLRRDGHMDAFEATIKEFDIDRAGRAILWPRSNDPNHQQPIILPAGGANLDEAGAGDVVISHLVIQSIRPE